MGIECIQFMPVGTMVSMHLPCGTLHCLPYLNGVVVFQIVQQRFHFVVFGEVVSLQGLQVDV